MTINFDMDGTFVNFYGVEGWLPMLRAEDATPYRTAKPLVNLSLLARYIHKLQRAGIEVCVISWGSKNGSAEFLEEVTAAKLEWLTKHLPSVEWDNINIVSYGTPKYTCGEGILFDDEEHNRAEWINHGGQAFSEDKIFEILKGLI